ncbi:hypothetical protein niasHT_024511 [Heterodera trifolii]|uniref:FLYWCH-type domain-containing protein n=1 Tax=Heterodera trifolii TaxID=157864 RepID=A0ABD2K7B0_9BILA
MQLEAEDDESITFKCRGSAHCPYRMIFYHRQSAIYIRHAHSHDAIVPIVGISRRSGEKGTTDDANFSSSSSANIDNAQQQTTKARVRFSDLCGNNSNDEKFGMEENGGKEREEEEEEEEERTMLEEDMEEERMEEEEDNAKEQIRPTSTARHRTPKGAVRCKKRNGHFRYWLPLGKISGAIDEVCREVCQLHYVHKSGIAKNGKFYFRCSNAKCNYKTMVDANKHMLYCRSAHNHPLPTDLDNNPSSPPSPSSPAAATFSPRALVRLTLSSPCSAASASALSQPLTAVNARNSCRDEWRVLASGVYGQRDILALCTKHSLKLLTMRRQTSSYLRCAQFGNACPYRVLWRRSDGRVYHRQRHDHAMPFSDSGNNDNSTRKQQQKRRTAKAQNGVGKMPLGVSSSSDSVVTSVSDETVAAASPPSASFVDKLGKRWTFLAKLAVFGGAAGGSSVSPTPNFNTSGGSRSTRSMSAAAASAPPAALAQTSPPSLALPRAAVPIPLEQQLEQLCAERHLSRSRLSSSATRIWLHCAQQRQPDVACPYRVVVHMPEGTVYHRLQHNHPVPYNLSPERENDQNGHNANNDNNVTVNRCCSSETSKSLSSPPSPVSRRRPETRSIAKKLAKNVRSIGTAARRRHMRRQAFVKARAAMFETGAQRQNEEAGQRHYEEEEEGIDEEITSLSSTDTDQSAYDSDHSAAYRPRTKRTAFGNKFEVRIKRSAFVKARASISSGVQADQQPELKIVTKTEEGSPSVYKFASKNWHFLTDDIWNKKALTDFCKENMLRVAGGIITNTYRNRLICVRSGCPFRALWLNRQGLVYGLRKHNHSMTPKIPLIVKEEPIDEQFKLADLEKEIQALAQRLSLLFRIENDVFVLMLPTEEGDQWLSRLLMLRDDNSSIRLAEFTGSSEAFAEKAEHWLKSDFDGPQQLMESLDAKCVEYFQQQKMAQEEDDF